MELPPYPGFGIEFECLLAKLEMEGAISATVIGYSTENVACVHFLTLGNNGT